MMNKKIFYLFALVLVTFSFSCKQVLLKMYNIKDPQIETKTSLLKFLNSFDLEYIPEIYTFKDTMSYYSTIINTAIPDAKFFNKNGDFVNYKKKPEDCNAKIDSFIIKIQDINSLPFDSQNTIDYYINNIVSIDNPSEKPVLKKNYDGYILIFWAKFTGKRLFKEKVVDWINNYYKNNRNMKLFFINFDFHDFWYENGNKTKK